jgi:hypothetical protein
MTQPRDVGHLVSGVFRVRRLIWQVLGGPLAVALIVFGVPGIGPAWTAHSGGGTAGTFTAVRQSCGKRSCAWYGDFRPTGGSVTRQDVAIGDGGTKINAAGDVVPAVDTGGRVIYPPGGGNDIWLLLALVAAGPVLLVVYFFTTIRPAWRWWRRRAKRDRSRPVGTTMSAGTSLLGGPVFRDPTSVDQEIGRAEAPRS